MTEKYILTGSVQFGKQYQITDSEINYAYKNNKSDKQKICDLLNKLTDENEKLKSDRFEEESKLECTAQMNRVFDLIDKKILECEKAVEEIRLGEKDSYIVKHDVASRMFKELKKELQE